MGLVDTVTIAVHLTCRRITGRSAPPFGALHALSTLQSPAGKWRGAMIELDWLFFTGLPCAMSDMLMRDY